MTSTETDSTVVDIEKLHRLLKDNLNGQLSIRGTIGKRKNLNSTCPYKQVYDPVVVSIGPYHHGRHALQKMEAIKWKYLEYILKSNGERTLNDYVKMLREICPIARSYYTEDIQMERNELVQIFLLDGCFLLLTLYGADWASENPNPALEEEPDEQIDLYQYVDYISDLLLTENQIPFLIVERIYELFVSQQHIYAPPSEKMAMFVERNILLNYPKAIRESDRPKNFCHLLHLCHIYLRPSQIYESFSAQFSAAELSGQWHQAMQYLKAGVEFQKREFHDSNPHSLLDVSFSDYVLEIPFLQIDSSTIIRFRNLIEFEQTSTQFGNDILSYIVFMSNLVTDAEDASMLVRKGIIQHELGSDEEVSGVFTELSRGIVFDYSGTYYLKSICHDLEKCYQSRIKQFLGWFSHKTRTIHN